MKTMTKMDLDGIYGTITKIFYLCTLVNYIETINGRSLVPMKFNAFFELD